MLRPGDIMPLVDKHSEIIGTEAMAELDREMTPILAELITLNSENNDHPTVEKLFNWLVAPERTGEEYFYVTGPLQRHVLKVMMEHFKRYISPMMSAVIPGMHAAKLAAEAMAVKCPILEGPWEHAAWVLIKECDSYSSEDYGNNSERLTNWVINVIGDPVLCPNHYLRIELMSLIFAKIDSDYNKSLRPHAIESVLFACSFLNIDYLLQSKPYYGDYHQMDLDNIIGTLNSITDDLDTEFDETLAKKLKNVKTLRLSAQFHDIAYHHALNFNKFEEPNSLHGLTAILQTINSYVQLNYKDYQDKDSDLFTLNMSINNITHLLNDFFIIFRESCLSPQLAGQSATCILTIIEIVISEYVNNECGNIFHTTRMLLSNLFGEHLNSQLYPNIESQDDMAVMLEYKKCLNNLKNNFSNNF